MSDVAQPADYAEAIAWFNECVAWRQQDRERRMFLAGRVAELEATIETMRAQHTDLLDDLDTLDGKYVAAQAELAALKAMLRLAWARTLFWLDSVDVPAEQPTFDDWLAELRERAR